MIGERRRARSGDEKGRGGAGKVGHALRLTADHWLAEAGHRSNQRHASGEETDFCFHVHFFLDYGYSQRQAGLGGDTVLPPKPALFSREK